MARSPRPHKEQRGYHTMVCKGHMDVVTHVKAENSPMEKVLDAG
ncbi:MAG: hypothetical protein Dbin4_02863 [Alphaproteobacteria bacterium]|nr:hypothetical protein [Alphaproteobacteria bacterium]